MLIRIYINDKTSNAVKFVFEKRNFPLSRYTRKLHVTNSC